MIYMKNIQQKKYTKQLGQALVVLLFYMVIAVTLVTTAVALTLSSSVNTMQEEEGNHALELAENGVENATVVTGHCLHR
jgi:Tfp pilus assembly protein PilX